MSVRRGSPKAVMALAHHMVLVIHQVLSRKEVYIEFGGDYYDKRNKPRTVSRLVKRLQKLGYQVDLREVAEEQPVVIVPEPGLAGPVISGLDSKLISAVRRRGRPCKCIERGIICKHSPSARALIR